MCECILPVSDACNARLRPPAPHAVQLLVAATRQQAIADIYAEGFQHPDRFWNILSNPSRTAALLREQGWQDAPARRADGAGG